MSPVIAPPADAAHVPPHVLTEARRLRKAGWSFDGLARRFNVSSIAIRKALGE